MKKHKHIHSPHTGIHTPDSGTIPGPGRVVILWLLIIGLTLPAAARKPERTPASDSTCMAAIDALVKSRAIDSTRFAILVTDLGSGETIAGYQSAKPLVPASIMKSLTVATLLDELEPDWRYSTKVYTDGKIRHGVLEGNLIVEGSGDPSINSKSGPGSADFIDEIRKALKEHEVDSIAGRIILDESIFEGPAYPASWASGDLSASYGTGSHGFNFENNASGKSAVRDVAGLFSKRLRGALAADGIIIGDNSLEEGRRRKLLEHKSAPLEEIMRSCMMHSDNLFAECFLRLYSHTTGGDGSTVAGAAKEAAHWRKRHAPMQGVEIIDGSGLSRSNRLTADFMTHVLSEMADNVEYASFFPLAGQEGTLRKFMKNTRLDSYLAMKTGSMRGIQCYAGYLLDEDFAPTHTIVVMSNNLKDRSLLREDLGKFFLSIF